MDKNTLDNLEQRLHKEYPFGIPRKQIGVATGGLLHPRTMANLDSAGAGIPGSYKFGRQMIYPVSPTVKFIIKKIMQTA